MEYTKGKWYWTRGAKGEPHNLRAGFPNGSNHILYVGDDFMGQYSFENAEANAQLIASAPKMHKICEQLADWDAGKFGKDSATKIIEISKQASKIIAELEGK